MRLIVVAPLLCAVSASGCLFDAALPPDAALSCVTDDDCPGDDVCVLGRCAPVEALRSDPPEILEATISPAVVGRGTVELSFTVGGNATGTPVVEADVGRPVRFDGVGVEGSRYRFSYATDGTEAPGAAIVTVTLLDALGRAATTAVGSFVVDLQAPAFTEVALVRTTATRGVEIGVDALLDADADVRARAVLADGSSVDLDVTRSGLRVRARTVVDERFTDGQLTLRLGGHDEAGNDSGDVDVGVVVVDLVTPTLTLQTPPTRVRPRDLVRFIVTSDETVTAPSTTVGTDNLLPDVGSGTAFGWSWLVPDPGADVDLTVTPGGFVDAAGNVATLPPFTVRIDRTPPQLRIDEPPTAQVREGDTIGGRFSFDEAVVVAGVSVNRFDEVVDATVVGDGAGPYDITIPVTALGAEGRYDVIVSAVDTVGNELRAELGSVLVDARAPTLLDATFNPPQARLGSTVTLQMTFSEALRVDANGDLPGLAVNVPLTFVSQSGATFTWTLVVTEETPELVVVAPFLITDLAGNEVLLPGPRLATLDVDNRAPGLRDVATRSARVRRQNGNVITITGTLDEPGAVVVATFAGRGSGCDVVAGGDFSCRLPVFDTDSDGTRPVTVTARDVAGNSSTETVLVTLDGEGPRVLSASFGRDAARPGTTVQFALLADESLAEAELGFSTGVVVVRDPGSTLGLTLTAPATGALTIETVRLVDDLGNSRTSVLSPVLTVAIDGVGPVVTGSALSTNARVPDGSAAKAGDVIVVEADVAGPLLETPSFRFGGSIMDIVFDDNAGHFRATHVVNAGDVEGVTFVTATAVDELGNLTFARLNQAILVDQTPPAVVPGTTQVAIRAPQNAPVSLPNAVGDGGLVTIAWVLSERTVDLPTFQLQAGAVIPDAVDGSGTSFSATFRSSSFTNGAQTILVDHEDLVGNVATLPLSTFAVDLVPPAPLDARERAILVHERAPHGSVSGAAPFHRVASRGSLPGRAGHTISVALDDRDLVRLASGPLAGVVSLALVRDLDRVFLQVYDEAGNVSTARGVTPRTEFFAGLNGRVIGSDASNPHRLELRRQLTLVDEDPSAEELNGVVVAQQDGVLLEALAEGRWQDSGPKPPPTPRAGVASTTHRDTVYLFGGCTSDGPSDEAWFFDGRGWVPLIGEDRRVPPARCGAALTSDDDRLFLYGGDGVDGLLDDVWAWDGLNWKVVGEPGQTPTPRRDMAFGFDRGSNEFVVYGGLATRGVSGEHWRSSNNGGTWSVVADGPAVTGGAAAFNDLGELIIAGGFDAQSTLSADVLIVRRDGIEVRSLPAPRAGGCALPGHGEIEVLGGTNERSAFLDAITIRDGVRPSPFSPLPGPLVTGGCGLFEGKPLFFGGIDDDDTLLDGTFLFFEEWREVGLLNLPSARRHAATATTGDVMFAFGGTNGTSPSGEVWELGEAWKLLGTMPPVERAGAVCLDENQCLIIGGFDDRGLRRTNALRWRRELDTPEELTNLNLTPRVSPAMAVDGRSGRVILFGGVTSAGNSLETCVLDDATGADLQWNCKVMVGPASSAGAVMTVADDAVVLWTAGALWRLGDGEWQVLEVKGPDAPPARQHPVLAFGLKRVWLHGGQSGSTLLDDLWSFELQQGIWRQHLPADPFGARGPGPRSAHAGFFDGRLKRLVVFSGDQGPQSLPDTWDFLLGDNERAGLVIDVSLEAASGFRDLAVNVSAATPHSVEAPRADLPIALPDPQLPGFTMMPIVDDGGHTRVSISPDESRDPLAVDAVDIRLVRP